MQIIHFDIRPGFVYLDEHRYVIKVLGMYYCTYVSDIDMSDLPVSGLLICFPQSIWTALRTCLTCQVHSDSLITHPLGCNECRLHMAIPMHTVEPESCSVSALSHTFPLILRPLL